MLPPPRVARKSDVLVDGGTRKIDEALLLWFPGPASFSGEDMAEIHLHGSPGVVRLLLNELARMPLVRCAEPGEFTKRAFLNGKMDLVEVEGLGDILDAETSLQVDQALFHVDGQASEVLANWRRKLVDACALVQASIDFSDEEGVAEAALPRVRESISTLHRELVGSVQDSARGRMKRQGVRVVLAGSPNVGKSSLLNALSKSDVAIVSDEPGTTRDVIEVSLDLDGLHVVLIDTAGLRNTFDSQAEQIGIERTLQRLGSADLVLNVASEDASWQDFAIDSPVLRIWNKVDLYRAKIEFPGLLAVSAVTGQGIPELLTALRDHAHRLAGGREPSLLVHHRQVEAVRSCIVHLDASLEPQLALELVAEELREASQDLAYLVGQVSVENLLDEIFSNFCIGK